MKTSDAIEMNNKLSFLQTYKDALENMVQIGGCWVVGQDKNLYHIEMPGKVKDCMWKNAKRYDIQTGKVMGYTNADRIRAMTDEELAAKIEELCQYTFMQISVYSKPMGKAEWLEWLKQEVSE